MSVLTLRPNSPLIVQTASIVGAPDAHTALSDNSDASYIQLTAIKGGTLHHVPDPVFPAGAIITAFQPRLRQSNPAGGGPIQWLIGDYMNWKNLDLLASTTLPTTISGVAHVGPFTQAQMNAIQLWVLGGPVGLRAYEVYADIFYVVVPTLVVDTPTGIITNTNQPESRITPTLDADGGLQTGARFKIFSSAQYSITGFNPDTSPSTVDSGDMAGAVTVWTPKPSLVNGDYRTYAQVWQSVPGTPRHASAWAFSPFTINVTPPSAPVLVLTSESISGRVKIDVTNAAGSPVTTDRVEIQRLGLDGLWVPVRTLADNTGLVGGATAVIRDYESSNGVLTQWRARMLHLYGGGLYAASGWTQAASSWSGKVWWLKHPSRPALNLDAIHAAIMSSTQPARQGVFQPVGSKLPVVVSDTRGGETGDIVMRGVTADRAAMDLLLDTVSVLLLQGPAGSDEPDRYVVVSNLTVERIVDGQPGNKFQLALSWVETSSPTGAGSLPDYVP